MQEGDIALIVMPQPDGTKKLRPVLLIKKVPPFNDWTVCAISSQLQQEVKGLDWVINKTDPGFQATGLKDASLIRLGVLATISTTVIPGTIGKIPAADLIMLKKRLASHLSS